MIRLRPAEPDDADFLLALAHHPEVEPFLSARRAKERDEVLAEIARSAAEPEAFGRLVIEVDGERIGSLGWERVNERSRIAALSGLALLPHSRGRGLGDEAARRLVRELFARGFHRLELEVYAFNERALRAAERVGFVREGVKRRAYLRHGDWVDGVLYGLLREDVGPQEDADGEY